MAVKLNLLPEGYALSGPLSQVVKLVRPLNVILLAFFLIVVLGMGGFFIFSSFSLRNLNTANDALKSKIQSQATAQQQIVLLKDRLKQIKTVQGLPTALKNMTSITPLLASSSGTILVSELGVDPQKAAVSVVFRSNSDLTSFVRSLNTVKSFNTVSLGAFSYNPGSGYLVTLNFSTK
ncbi:MAG TPA: hypothetical protein VKC53_04065 [Patescibacteria group bacterium]|nr:hypothetical protein [Patescibacteria group bacterium]